MENNTILNIILLFSILVLIFIVIPFTVTSINDLATSHEAQIVYNQSTIINNYGNYYQTNIKPSEQCAGININNMQISSVVYTGSMRPTITGDSTLLYIPYNSSRELVIGDIVSTEDYTHRVVAINNITGEYWTKGDNNRDLDHKVYHLNDTIYVICGILYN